MQGVFSWAQGTYNELSRKNSQWLQADEEASKTRLDKSLDDLALVADGVEGNLRAWSAGIEDNATMETVVGVAREKGMLAAGPLDAVPTLTQATKDARDSWKSAVELAGKVLDESTLSRAESILQRAVLTHVEVQLCKTYEDADMDKEERRAFVSAQIRKLRHERITEKAAFLGSMYRWAYQAITVR